MLSKQHLDIKIFLKATFLFYSGNVFAYSLHELSHATVAYFLHVPATLFHFYADIDQNQANESDRILIALTGPVFSLIVGLLFCLLYRKSTMGTARLLSLYTATMSLSIFSGNLFSASMVGDFSTVTRLLQFSDLSRYAITTTGLLALILTMFIGGRELLKITEFEGPQKVSIILHLILVPLFVGTSIVVITYYPLPSQMIGGIISSSFFWVFSIPGVATGKLAGRKLPTAALNLTDVALFFVSILVVRILATGIAFG